MAFGKAMTVNSKLLDRVPDLASEKPEAGMNRGFVPGGNKIDHILTLDMAKEISMIQRTERGKQARQYFIECERRMKQLQPELTPEQLMAKALPCSKPDLNIRLKSIIVMVSFYKDLNQARFTRNKLGQCIEPRSCSRRPRGFA